jgi:hypothetical protein
MPRVIGRWSLAMLCNPLRCKKMCEPMRRAAL